MLSKARFTVWLIILDFATGQPGGAPSNLPNSGMNPSSACAGIAGGGACSFVLKISGSTFSGACHDGICRPKNEAGSGTATPFSPSQSSTSPSPAPQNTTELLINDDASRPDGNMWVVILAVGLMLAVCFVCLGLARRGSLKHNRVTALQRDHTKKGKKRRDGGEWTKTYAAFLSHYKAEAGPTARILKSSILLHLDREVFLVK